MGKETLSKQRERRTKTTRHTLAKGHHRTALSRRSRTGSVGQVTISVVKSIAAQVGDL